MNKTVRHALELRVQQFEIELMDARRNLEGYEMSATRARQTVDYLESALVDLRETLDAESLVS